MKLLLFARPHETESLRALSDCVFLEELQQATQLDSISFSQLGRRLSQLSDFSPFSGPNPSKNRLSNTKKNNDTTKNRWFEYITFKSNESSVGEIP